MQNMYGQAGNQAMVAALLREGMGGASGELPMPGAAPTPTAPLPVDVAQTPQLGSDALSNMMLNMIRSNQQDAAGFQQNATGRGAGLANVMSRIAAEKTRAGGNAKIEDIMMQISEAKQREAGQAREQTLADEQRKRTQGIEDYRTKAGIDQQFGGKGGAPSGVREFKYLTDVMNNPEKYPENVVNAAKIELGLNPRAGSSAAERIAVSPDLAENVAETQATIQGRIAGAKAEAAALAKSRGEAFTELNALQASLPPLRETIEGLKVLAQTATYTMAGRAFDNVAKELGFGSTSGGDSRAKFISIADNQILPLLRETFGAQFTENEGKRLRDAFADPNATPSQKVEQLEAFISQKERNLTGVQSRVEGLGGADPAPQTGTSKYKIIEVN